MLSRIQEQIQEWFQAKIAPLIERLRRAYEDLSEREQRLAMITGSIALIMIIVLPMYSVGASVAEISEESRELSAAIAAVEAARGDLLRRQAEAELLAKRYEVKAPPLGTFIEQEARRQKLSLSQVVDQPRQTIGEYTRRGVRVDLRQVELFPILKLLEALENSSHAVSITRLQLDRPPNSETFTVQIGLTAYDLDDEPDDAPARSGR